MRQAFLVVVCACVLATLFFAGLYPFTPYPKNQVTWVGATNGVRLGRHGTLLSSAPLKVPASSADSFCTLEIWLQPATTTDSNTILAFYNADNPLQFQLRQTGRHLLVSRDISQAQNRLKSHTIILRNVFDETKAVFITITSGGKGTAFYLNGIPTGTHPDFNFTGRDMAAQIVILGNSPVANDSWSGQIFGLAFYSRELAPDQVAKHFKSWATDGQPDLIENEQPVAIYPFREHHGNVVHNLVFSSSDLYAPASYVVLREPFLVPPWKEFRADWGYVQDIAVNIGGFIPFGFFFCAYLSSIRMIKKPRFAAIFLAGAISLTIEVLQAYLPTRSSGMTDIITNTSGSAVGAFLYSGKTTHTVLRRWGLCGRIDGQKSLDD